jgi:uroporphyrinogen decarboxylase
MNKIERVLAALRGQQPDRVPASFWYHFPPKGEVRGDSAVKAHLNFFRESRVDFLKIMNEHPYQVTTPIKNPSDWRKIKPAPLESDFFQAQLDEIKMITDQLGDACLTTTTIFNPFSSGNHASGKLVTEHLKADPDSVNIGLQTIAESQAEFALACLQAGADGIYFSAQGGEADRFDERTFLEVIKPTDLTVLNAVKGEGILNITHICNDNIRLHLYSDYPGDVINWAATAKNNIPLAAGKGLFNRTILGGMDNRGVIVSGPVEDIQRKVHEIIDDFGIRNLIIGADCTLPSDINIEHIQAVIEATEGYTPKKQQ